MLDNFFKFNENGTNFKTEVLAGITTFLAMAYILGVNPSMLSEANMPSSGVFFATAISSGISCIIMGLLSRYPIGLAPGMGLNALFTYTIILEMHNSWQTALAAVFISNLIFLLITISGLREDILNIIPKDLKLGISVGIGFFLAFLGLKGAGIIVSSESTLVAMGTLTAPHTFLSLIGIGLSLVLFIRRVPASVFFGLILTAIIGLIFTACGFGAGNTLMPSIPSQIITTTFDTSLFGGFIDGFAPLFSNIPNFLIITFSLLFVTFFDTTGTLITLGRQCGFIDEEGNAKNIEKAFLSDALGGIIGSIFGTSTVSAYVESATGIELGGKTGLTAIIVGILFILSIFIAPLILSLFTSSITASALVIVGILMVTQLSEIEWNNIVVAASVFMMIIMMLLTYSISLGIAWGFVIYTLAVIASGKIKELSWGMHALAIVFIIYLFFGL